MLWVGLSWGLGAAELEVLPHPVPPSEAVGEWSGQEAADRASQAPTLGEALAPHPLDLPTDGLAPQTPVITVVALDRANRLFATGGDDHRVRLWELPEGRLKQRIGAHQGWVRAATFSPDGLRLATGGDDRCVMIFRVGEELPLWKVELGAAIYAIGFTPDGTRLVAAGFSDKIWVLDAATGRQIAVWTGPGEDIRALAISPDGRQLAAGARNGTIRLWNWVQGERQRDVAAHGRRVRTLAYSPDGSVFVSGGEDGRVILCDPTKAEPNLRLLAQSLGAVHALTFCGQDRLAVGCTDNRIYILSFPDARVLRELAGHTGTVAALGWESGTHTLISGGFDTTVRFWQLGPHTERPLAQQSPAPSPLPAGMALPGQAGQDRLPRLHTIRSAAQTLETIFPREVP